MTNQQEDMTRLLRDELAMRGQNGRIEWKESNSPESGGYLFGEVEGVTVTVSPGGLMNIAAVRTYHPQGIRLLSSRPPAQRNSGQNRRHGTTPISSWRRPGGRGISDQSSTTT